MAMQMEGDSSGADALGGNVTIARIDRVLTQASRWLAGGALATVLAFTAMQVVNRYLIKSTFSGYDQLARIALVLLTFVGISLGIRDRVNVRIEVLAHLASARVNRILAAALECLMCAMAALLVYVGYQLLEIGAMQPILGTPFTYRVMYGALLLGMILLVLFLLLRFAAFVSACLRTGSKV